MAIKEGDKIPDLKLKTPNADGMPEDITTGELFGGKKVVLFAVPGAFTPLCSAQHLPGFIEKADEIKAKGVDTIVCMAVNDAFVMGAWGKDRGAGDKVVMLADGNGELTRALGLEMDVSVAGLGQRAQRFAMIVEDGVVKKLAVEAPQKFEVSSADAILTSL
jgi:peroxiredoxin